MDTIQKKMWSLIMAACLLFSSLQAVTAEENMPPSQELTVTINGISFEPSAGKVYYRNDQPEAETLEELAELPTGEPDYNAYFNPLTYELTLNKYVGGAIHFQGTAPKDVTVRLIGDNEIKENIANSAVANQTAGDLVITSAEQGKLEIVIDYQGREPFIYGIVAGQGEEADEKINNPVGNVRLQGNAKVEISLTSNGSEKSLLTGIYGKEVTVKEQVTLDIEAKSKSKGVEIPAALGIHSQSGVLISTDSVISVDVSAVESHSYTIVAETGNENAIRLEDAQSITLKWKAGQFDLGKVSEPEAKHNQRQLKKTVKNNEITYSHVDWHKVTVINGETDRQDGEYYYGEVVTVSAAAITVPFKKWLYPENLGIAFYNPGGANDPKIRFDMPLSNIEFMATYDVYNGTPVFTEASRKITIPISDRAGMSSPAAIYLVTAGGSIDIPEHVKAKMEAEEYKGTKEFLVNPDRVNGGTYQLIAQIDDIYHRSEEFQVIWNDRFAADVEIKGRPEFGAELTAQVKGLAGQPAPEEGNIQYQWYLDNDEIASARSKTYQVQAMDIGRILKVEVSYNGKEGKAVAVTPLIKKGFQEAPDAIDAAEVEVTQNQIAIKEKFWNAHPEYQYRLVKATDSDAVWIKNQANGDDRFFTGLSSGEKYLLTLQKPESNTHLPSADSPQLEITTKKQLTGEVELKGEAKYGNRVEAFVKLSPVKEKDLRYHWQRVKNGVSENLVVTDKKYQITEEDIDAELICVVVTVNPEYAGQISQRTAKVEKQDGDVAPMLTSEDFKTTFNSISFKEEATGMSYEFRLQAEADWKTGAEKIAGLVPDTEYSVEVRAKQTSTRKASAIQELRIRTQKESGKPSPQPQPQPQPKPQEPERKEHPQPYVPKDNQTIETGKAEIEKPKAENKEQKQEKNTMDQSKQEGIHLPFSDVKKGEWYEKAVQFVHKNGWMHGTDAAHFMPDAEITRSQLITILHRMAGMPTPKGQVDFQDVEPNSYYQNAIIWASENKITGGYGNGLFGVRDNITREQFAVLLYRLAKLTGKPTEIREDLSSFVDSKEISDYSMEALSWAKAAGYITGTDENHLLPKGNATRSQIAAILMRYHMADTN